MEATSLRRGCPPGRRAPNNTVGGYFKDIEPKRPVFGGGPGTWELVLRNSYPDLDSHNVQGVTFGRITPMVNWYLSQNVRLEMGYGYGHSWTDSTLRAIRSFSRPAFNCSINTLMNLDGL